jgi:hypothetical protein
MTLNPLKPKKSLDAKIARILADPSCKDFILADAKDADMAGGMAAPGKHLDGKLRTLDEYRELIRANVRQGLVDIMLMSASTNERLTIQERLFDGSHVTPAARANDTTDIHLAAGGVYPKIASRPFRTATLQHIMFGRLLHREEDPRGLDVMGADLGLYSVTFNNDLERDLEALMHYRDFRTEAELHGFRHFLEVFNPNACDQQCIPPEGLGRYINDMIARTLAGVAGKGRPIFLKIAYNGPAAMEQLASYDRSLIVGILGGSSGTTLDAFAQLAEAKKYGARVALYGRMINNSEHQLTFIQHLRWIADGEITDAAAAVKSYHAELAKLNIAPYRKLEDDLVSTLRGTAYGSTGGQTPASAKASASAKPAPSVSTIGKSKRADARAGLPEKVRQNLERLDQAIG